MKVQLVASAFAATRNIPHKDRHTAHIMHGVETCDVEPEFRESGIQAPLGLATFTAISCLACAARRARYVSAKMQPLACTLRPSSIVKSTAFCFGIVRS